MSRLTRPPQKIRPQAAENVSGDVPTIGGNPERNDWDVDLAKINTNMISDEQKCQILNNTQTKRTRANHQYPSNQQKRRYNQEWEATYSWLQYSPSEDGAYCATCLMFSPTSSSILISTPFRDWKNAIGTKRGILTNHHLSKSHQSALQAEEEFKAVSSREKASVLESPNQSYSTCVKKNRAALLAIIDVVICLAKRGIAFRGSWEKSNLKETGNFEFFIDWIAKYDESLEEHLKMVAKNARYLSPQIQNELIDCLGDSIRTTIVSEIAKSKFVSLMADESQDVSTIEQLSVCIRYLSKPSAEEMQVHETFLGFVELPRTDAATITASLLEHLLKWGVDLNRLRGMGFDGAATMSGSATGVQARITQQYPKAKYFTHCSSHCLNLVIVSGCTKVQEISNFMATFKELTLFFSYSAKRKDILKAHMHLNTDDLLADCPKEDHEQTLFSAGLRRQNLPTLSDTRWLSRVDSISTILVNYQKVYDAVAQVQAESRGKSAHDASAFLHSMEQFTFIVAAVLTQYILGCTRPLSVLLQSTKCDLLKAHNDARCLIKVMESIRSEEKFEMLYERAVKVAEVIDVQPSKPRTVARQTHRANAAAQTVPEYYRLNYYYPFLDHIISHMNTRFPDAMKGALLGTILIPANLEKVNPAIVEEIKTEFINDLPMPSSFQQEIDRWKIVHQGTDVASLPDAISCCDELLYPNISTILQLILTLPVGSCSCERSFSSLRRLKTWSRSTMGTDRLNGLALAYVHDITPDPLQILQKWDASGHRRIALAFSK